MKVGALVPAKSFGRAKSRLAGALTAPERARLARACFTRVVSALEDAGLFSIIVVCTDGEEVAALARARGCEVLYDPPVPIPFAQVVDAGLARLEGVVDRAVVVMADLPEAEGEAFSRILDDPRDVVLVPDAVGLGTSALSLPLPAPFLTGFGSHDSAARHEALARGAGLTFSRREEPSLARDVDGPLDLLGRASLYEP